MKLSSTLVLLLTFLVVCSVSAQIPGTYIHPDFGFQWALTDTNSAAFAKPEGTWQQAVYTGLGKYDFFASYTSKNGNETWEFFGFSWNGSAYVPTWTYTQHGMSGSLEANERMLVVGDWNNDGKKELMIGVDPEQTNLPNLLVFEPDGLGNLPSTPTASLITPKADRYFGTTPPVTHKRFSWSSPPAYVRDIDKDGKNDFVGFGYEGLVVGKYTGLWSDPNAVDNVVWKFVDSMMSVGSTLADLDGDGYVELVNASAMGFGPNGPNDLPGTFKRKDYFAICKPSSGGTYTTIRMASPSDSTRMANGYKAFPAAYMGGGYRAVTVYDIDGDGKDEVFVADWGSYKLWMIKLGNKPLANIDSTDFYPLADYRTLFGTPAPDPLYAANIQVADMNGNGKPEFYSGLGPWGTTGAASVVRAEYQSGDPKSPASWLAAIVYRDTTHHIQPRQVLAAGDMTGNGKQELVIINANPVSGGGTIVVLEAKPAGIVADTYIHPDFGFQWALTDTNSAAFAKPEGTWQQAVYTGLGKYDFFASYTSKNGNETWEFFGFSWNGSAYVPTWTYTQHGMSGSLEANERMLVVGDWNNDGKKELMIGVDPEQTNLPNLLVFEPDGLGNLPSTPTASLITPKADRYFGTTPPVTHKRFSWSSPPAYVRDIDKDGKNDFVGFGYEGLVVGKYTGLWSDPNAVDNVVWKFVDSMMSVGSTLADLDEDGYVELVNASAMGFGPNGPNDLPGTFKRKDYFAICKPSSGGTYTTIRMASPSDSTRMANGYKAFPAAYMGGGYRAVTVYDIDGDGKDEVFVADWGSYKLWMIKLGNKPLANIDSTDFYPLADYRTLFGTPAPDPLYAANIQVADMNGNGKPEFYSGLGPWGTTGAASVVRAEYQSGDPKSPASWLAAIVYRDTAHHIQPRQVLAAGDMTGNGKQELVIINANPVSGGGTIVVLESKTFTSVDETYGVVPEKFAISQNYPNPFNPSTKIKYSIPQETQVRLEVYNVLGQKVAELVNTIQRAGRYEVTLNANNFASGVYFYRMQAGPFVEIKKMMLMK